MSARPPHRFDADWREQATLADGTTVLVRLVRPDDKGLLRAGFERLSPGSRYLRFFTAKEDLSDRELALLTELDGEHQLAIGAVRQDAEGRWEGLGVARFTRDPDRPTVAEAAVTVTDAAQGKGLGTLLLARLADAARERGIDRFAAEFLAGNAAVRQLIEEACPDARLAAGGGVVRAEIPLPRAGAPSQQAPGRRLFRHIVGGKLEMRLRHLLLKDPEGTL